MVQLLFGERRQRGDASRGVPTADDRDGAADAPRAPQQGVLPRGAENVAEGAPAGGAVDVAVAVLGDFDGGDDVVGGRRGVAEERVEAPDGGGGAGHGGRACANSLAAAVGLILTRREETPHCGPGRAGPGRAGPGPRDAARGSAECLYSSHEWIQSFRVLAEYQRGTAP